MLNSREYFRLLDGSVERLRQKLTEVGSTRWFTKDSGLTKFFERAPVLGYAVAFIQAINGNEVSFEPPQTTTRVLLDLLLFPYRTRLYARSPFAPTRQ